MIGSTVRLYLVDDYLVIADHKSADKLIHLFDGNDFNYVTSIANIGQGSGEITVIDSEIQFAYLDLDALI
ncbi:hypothetical protein [Sphingobacterium sp. FBM7-1]|uniref:hypothetical protein n=1 Tax=Sphingobacterium sp. FBM7-1 TaxID=2886688 RepID=UPI001D10A63F|nr:hypothetical protein [Sphingobacterium sp. FBM7-1]MCC2599284.1 hypothetical protein [Sphingobacterium sp. FBM7-1]